MINQLKFLITFLIFLGTLSCSKTVDSDIEEMDSLTSIGSIVSSFQQSEILGTTELLAHITIDDALCAEVHKAVNQSVEYGLDEELFLRELWSDKSSIKVKSLDNQSILKSRIEEFFSKHLTKSMDAETYYSNSDLVIYWPYSDNWDGISRPTIVSAPEDPSQEWNYGYRISEDNIGNVRLDTVIVNDDYAYENPVWIINYSDYDYNDIPYFNLGENCLDNNVFLGGVLSTNNIKTKSEDLNIWYFRRMQCRHQYDSIFNGGSNFKATVTYPPSNGKAGGNTIFHITFTRKQIRKKTTKNVDAIMNTDWTEDEISNHLFMIETDNLGSEISTTISAKYKDESGEELTYSNTIKYKSDDTEVVSQEYKRTYAFSSLGQSEQVMDRGYISFWMEVVNYTE